jgi:hypothetical protein
MSFEQEKFSVTKMMNNIPKKRPFSSALRDNSKLIMYTFERAGYTRYSEIFLINNCQCQNEVKNHTVPP